MARLHVALDYDKVSARRFMYIADCVARDIKREEEERKKAEALARARQRKAR